MSSAWLFWNAGSAVGANVAELLGKAVGISVVLAGILLGLSVGNIVGVFVGALERWLLGEFVVMPVGVLVGLSLGTFVGTSLGQGPALKTGEFVGLSVGEVVEGSVVGQWFVPVVGLFTVKLSNSWEEHSIVAQDSVQAVSQGASIPLKFLQTAEHEINKLILV